MYALDSNRRRKKNSAGKLIVVLILLLVVIAAVLLFTGRDKPEREKGAVDLDKLEMEEVSSEDSAASGDMQKLSLMESDIYKGDLILVNNKVKYTFPGDEAFVSVFDYKTSDYFVRDTNVLLAAQVIAALNSFAGDFLAETGLKTLNVVSGVRTYEDQQNLYEKSLSQHGAEHTARFTAEPGGSEHHTGLALDFALFYEETGASGEFDGTGEYAWLEENAWKYGFIKRYKGYKEELTGIAEEAWHFRYVGIPHAYLMDKYDLCLEEYLMLFTQRVYTYDGNHLKAECLGKTYEIYYCEGTEIYVPTGSTYTVSGNGTDGFIVTVEV